MHAIVDQTCPVPAKAPVEETRPGEAKDCTVV